jgi:hypothetical protein
VPRSLCETTVRPGGGKFACDAAVVGFVATARAAPEICAEGCCSDLAGLGPFALSAPRIDAARPDHQRTPRLDDPMTGVGSAPAGTLRHSALPSPPHIA